jgi:hypothetical protein
MWMTARLRAAGSHDQCYGYPFAGRIPDYDSDITAWQREEVVKVTAHIAN